MPTCATTFNTWQDAWILFIFGCISGLIYGLFSKFWDNVHYAYLRFGGGIFIPEKFHRILSIFLLLISNYAAWRVWSCGNWDYNTIPLFLWLLWVVVFSLVVPMIFLTKNYIVNAVWGAVHLIFAITVLVFFFFEDTWSGIIFILETLFGIYWLITGIYIAWNRKTFNKATFNQFKDTIQNKKDTMEVDELSPMIDNSDEKLGNKFTHGTVNDLSNYVHNLNSMKQRKNNNTSSNMNNNIDMQIHNE